MQEGKRLCELFVALLEQLGSFVHELVRLFVFDDMRYLQHLLNV